MGMNLELLPIVLAAAIAPFLILLLWGWALRERKPVAPLLVRLRDRAIFEAGCAHKLDEPDCSRCKWTFRRLEWKTYHWLPGGRLVPTDETWSCNDPSLYDVVAREYVIEGLKILHTK